MHINKDGRGHCIFDARICKTWDTNKKKIEINKKVKEGYTTQQGMHKKAVRLFATTTAIRQTKAATHLQASKGISKVEIHGFFNESVIKLDDRC
jgi:hypothetical protein